MTTVQKMKDAEKAALQDELKYYSGLLAAHYSSAAKIHNQRPNVQSNLTRNPAVPACSTFKTTTNHVHHFKSSSLQSRSVSHLPNQNSKAVPSFNLHKRLDLPDKTKVSNSFSLRKYPSKSSMVKLNFSASSFKSQIQAEKAVQHNILLKKNLPDSEKGLNPGLVNKPPGLSSQVLMDEMSVLIKQLKQKTKHIDNEINRVSSKVNLSNKCGLGKPELKATTKPPADSKMFCKTSSIINQTIDSNSYSSNDEKNSRRNLTDNVDGSCVKPLNELRNSFLPHSDREMLEIPSKSFTETSENLSTKLENPAVLQVNSIVKTPVRKKLIRKRSSSVKKLNGTKLFASKYKVVNKKLPGVQNTPVFKKVTSPEVKTALNIKSVKKLINSGKKIKGGARLITSKYKIINKKMPNIQSLNFESSVQGKSEDKVCKLPINDKWASWKTNGTKLRVNKLKSKYKIVNKSEKSVSMPISLFANKSIIAKESKLGNSVHQGNKNLNQFSIRHSPRKNIYTSKLHGERKVVRSMAALKQNHLHVFNLKRKKHGHFQNSFISNSKYRTVNKHPSNSLKKNSETEKSNNMSIDQNSGIDLDLLMELAAEKKELNDNLVINCPNKHILVKRVYKSKNAIVNKNISSLQTKAAKMIKTKYSILNKRHSWQKQSFNKRLISPKSFKGQKFTNNYQRKMSFFHSQRNKRNNSSYKSRHHVSTYYAGRSYSRSYLVSKNRSNVVGSLQSMVRTPKRFVLNRKVYLKTPNSVRSVPVSKTMASRALNRSINRVLTASVKKKTSKVNIYCMFYNRFGRCNKGIKCPFVHDPSKIAVCTRFLRGTCKHENCPFSHEICPGKMAICSFFLLESCTKIDCPYRHEKLSPNAKLCKAFVQGYCPNGKQCKHAHVLVCPQFVQGRCEKGNACPFPHPPSKEKKTIPNSVEKIENVEETEEQILEKMSRYFECADESMDNDKCSITVPRIRNLPEQPSFIAL